MLSASTRLIFSVISETLPNFGPSSNQQSVTGAGLKDRPIKFCNGILDFSDSLMKRHNLNIDKSSFSLLDECFIKRAFIRKGRSEMVYNFENGIV